MSAEEESNVLLELFIFSLISAFIILFIFYVIKIGCAYRLGVGVFSTSRSTNRSRTSSSSSIRNGLPSFLSDLTTFQRKAILNVLFTDRKCGSSRVQKVLHKDQDGEEKREVSTTSKEVNIRNEDDEEMQKAFCLEKLAVETSKEDVFGRVTKDQIFEKNEDNDGLCAICLGPYNDGDVIIKSKYCSHYFHKECIMDWLEKKWCCPCCRNEMVSSSDLSNVVTVAIQKIHSLRSTRRR